MYFVLSDVFMLLQYVYYTSLKKRHERLLQQRKAEIHRQHQQALSIKSPSKSKSPYDPASSSMIPFSGLNGGGEKRGPPRRLAHHHHQHRRHRSTHSEEPNTPPSKQLSLSSNQSANLVLFEGSNSNSSSTNNVLTPASSSSVTLPLTSSFQVITIDPSGSSASLNPSSNPLHKNSAICTAAMDVATHNRNNSPPPPVAREVDFRTNIVDEISPESAGICGICDTKIEDGGEDSSGNRVIKVEDGVSTEEIEAPAEDDNKPLTPTRSRSRLVSLVASAATFVVTGATAAVNSLSDTPIPLSSSSPFRSSSPLDPDRTGDFLGSNSPGSSSTIVSASLPRRFLSPLPFAFVFPPPASPPHPPLAVLPLTLAAALRLRVSSGSASEFEIYLGTLMGYLSTVCYLASRVSQIRKNYKRQSAEGLSWIMFCMTVSANLCSGMGMLVRTVTWAEFMNQLPWLCGTFGTVSLDVAIVYQTFL
eukprot:CAMPEP_0175059326 /NCGR_PEP_ID=MMETSP0052_2-20121109/12369_1 /TAXON_ID=51329 ORGANISM="Polytomella parva, Strain SAG 63-3" /NCGR_SAMPLE_ID=MMETSP0052_2 /ASSEMBLY_ACC=CAM_ASM_000194 /LENGTH=475 /DNA_ID=CAMNT_0016324861 /DNA_START=206 /DNA_END=1630 /DNA_ORIENTATION=-